MGGHHFILDVHYGLTPTPSCILLGFFSPLVFHIALESINCATSFSINMGDKEVEHIRIKSKVCCYSYVGDFSEFLGQMEENTLFKF